MTAAPSPIERAYRVRLRPTRAQARMLRRLLGAKRYVWNWALGESKAAYRDTGQRLPLKNLSTAFTALRRAPETSWLSQLPREPFNQVLRDLERAYTNAYARRAAFPVFKRRGTVSAVRFTLDQRREQVDREGGVVQIDGIGRIRFRVTQALVGRLRSVTVSLDGAGRWYASFTADQVPAPAVAPATVPALGIDLGLRDAVVLSTGENVAAPKPLKPKLARLRRYQRSYARQRDQHLRRMGLDPGGPIPKGTRFEVSIRARKNQARIGRLHAQVADQRREYQHQLSRRIVDRALVIALEDLNLAALAKSMGRRGFRRSVADVGLGELRRQIEYKAAWAGRTVVRVDRYYPSSKTCGACGHVHAGLHLGDRIWACPSCGTHHDRDLNAAKNIEREGLRLLAQGTCPDGPTRRSRGRQARGADASAAGRSSPAGQPTARKRELSYRGAQRRTPAKAQHDVAPTAGEG